MRAVSSNVNREESREWLSGGNHELIDYDSYIMKSKEKLLYTAAAAVVIFAIGFVFYRSIIFSLLLCPLAFFYPKIRAKELILKRKHELNLQFKDMLYALASSLSAGKSAESAFRETLRDLSIQYPDPEAYIIQEVEYIVRKIEMNETVEAALEDFAVRSHVEDIENFVDVFQTCKRTGGNIIEVIKNTSNIINDKIEIKQEIDTLLAARRFEQKVLNAMPILMILIISMSAGDYIDPVFHTLQGRIAMTFSILLLAAAYFISQKIMRITV